MHCDAVVIGLGPAGAHFSYLASKLGYKVVALERGTIHDSKTCAGAISPVSVRIIREHYEGVPSDIVERRITRISLATSTEGYSINLPRIEAFTTQRSKFDRWLAAKAIEMGTIVIQQCSLRNVSFSKESAKVEIHENGSTKEIEADCLIGAYGVGSPIYRMVGLPHPETVIGVQCELDCSFKDIETSMSNSLNFCYDSHFSTYGYCWIFPKKDHVTIGLLSKNPSHAAEHLRDFVKSKYVSSWKLANFDRAPRRMKAALLPNEILKETYKDRVILIGDAAGFGDRITWEGISYALQSANCAAKAFTNAYEKNNFSSNMLCAYQQLCQSAFGKDIIYGKKLQKILFDRDIDMTWSRVISFLKEKPQAAMLLMNEMEKHMSIARALRELPRKEKLLLLKYVGYWKGLSFLLSARIG